jgi:hypothetical protein
VLPGEQLASPTRHRGPSDFRSDLKFLTFHKYWKNPNWWKKKTKKPPEDLIIENWHKSRAHKNWILPVTVPQNADARKHRLADTFRIRSDFLKQTLVPACLAAGCVHK